MVRRSVIFASFPENTFLENIAIDHAGMIYVTSLEEEIVYRFDQEGNKTLFARINGKLAGISYLNDESFLLNGWDEAGVPTIYRLDADGEAEMADQPAGASFLNGMALLNKRTVLICDAYAGCIWSYNVVENITSKWLEHPLLTKIDMAQFFMPGANGIKIFNSAVYVSNTERRLHLHIPVIDERPLTPEVIISDINLDDFAFDDTGVLFDFDQRDFWYRYFVLI